MFDQIHEECGVFGVYSPESTTSVVGDTYMALYALQHRGQQSCGIAVNDDGIIRSYRDLGLVPDTFNQRVLNDLGSGRMAVGHVLYGASNPERADAQPLVVRHIKGSMALAFNGALVNALELKEELELKGAIFHSNSDAEIISHVIINERLHTNSIEEAIEKAMDKLKGAYSMVVMSPQKLMAVRDPQGIRPLAMGKMGGEIVFASESCAFDSIGAKFVRDVRPGEIIVVDRSGVRSLESHCGQKSGLCVFEYVYTARPDSVIEGESVHMARKRAGAFLAQEHPVEADIVIGSPDSGLDAALGYAEESGIPYGIGFIKNRYIGRTFILPTQKERERAVHIKLNVLEAAVKGKRVVLVDDSIVRGTTSIQITKMLRDAGATEVHLRISSPPFINPCYFGTDIDSKDKLIACRMSMEEIRRTLDVDTLGYLSIEHCAQIARTTTGCEFCMGCFTGKYPIDVPEEKPCDKFSQKLCNK
ncbi:amidophosphoribosyltransferase [Negativibacillus massiliensis]|uniref:amidophosphoribosyltransferase n=1 Tax=Negativibacillus massiliensis TaxID=1871035 RepID=UPI000339113C|nr:amidophosphoribosyltransferase [Negativibacillus massiliensis]MDY4047013.1 amidophosphoribosyltransferase [Negativibacillus massiliensis]CDA78816.1 amidophosphoribosyltransferase [Clostridium sp. CAG:242]